ncbi:MAG: VCBS repeat-containing protein, partial [Bacteroidota bacterium]
IFEKLIEEKVPNCLFLNQGNLQFAEQAKTWQLDRPSFSNGAAFADFDQNGQLDIVVNNINDDAFLLKNNGFDQQNYLQIQFGERERYSQAIGAKVHVFAGGQQQFQAYYLNRAYLSSYSPFLHFGLGVVTAVDSVVVQWPNFHRQTYENVAVNQVFEVESPMPSQITSNLKAVKENTVKTTANFKLAKTPLKTKPTQQNDFSFQRTLPFAYSSLGPVVALTDLDNNQKKELVTIDGSEDFIKIYRPEVAQVDTIKGLIKKGVNGLLVVDLNQDGLQDMAITYGGYGVPATSDFSAHFEVWLNNGGLNFEKAESVIFSGADSPSLGVIRGTDMDGDGDIDLFLGGTVSRNNYPIASHSYIWKNDLDVANPVKDDIIDLQDLGIVMDALWTDMDNDGQKELMVAAHLKPIQIIHFSDGQLSTYNHTTLTETGFWNSIHPTDYDQDGDIDYLLSNLGTNTPLSNGTTLVTIAYHDQDNNGSIDGFVGFHFNKEEQAVPFAFRNEVIAQLPNLKKTFKNYQSFAGISFQDFMEVQASDNLQQVAVQQVKHQLLKNQRDTFLLEDLPTEAQTSPMYGMANIALDEDNLWDVLGATNLSDSREFWGAYTALDGAYLQNRGDYRLLRNEPKIVGDSRSIVPMVTKDKITYFITRVDEEVLALTSVCSHCFEYAADAEEVEAVVQFKDGTVRKEEFYHGHGFRSQGLYGFWLPDIRSVASIRIGKRDGTQREIYQDN